MKTLHYLIPAIFLFALVSCDLMVSKDHRDIYDDVAYEVWLAKQPNLVVRMDTVSGSGITNPAVGPINNPQPKLEVPFTVSFAVNPGWGFVEWRAYTADIAAALRTDENKLDKNDVEFGTPTGKETSVKINSNEELVVIPFSVRLPEVEKDNIPAYGLMPTNYIPEFRFNVPVDPASLILGSTEDDDTTITVMRSQGSTAGDDWSPHFTLEKDMEGGRWIRLEPKDSTIANREITITLNTGIRHRDYPNSDLKMSAVYTKSYSVGKGPDKDAPVVENIRASGDGDSFFTGNIDTEPENYRLALDEQGTAVVYLFFDTFKTGSIGSVEEVGIVEERIRGINGELLSGQIVEALPRYQAEALLDSVLPPAIQDLAEEYLTDFRIVPYVIQHEVQTTREGIVRFFIQPVDSFGNGDQWDRTQALSNRYYVDAFLDLPPSPVTNLAAYYYKNTSTITVNWTDPPEGDLDHIRLEWGRTGGTQETIDPIAKGTRQFTASGIVMNSEYTFTLYGVDKAGHESKAEIKIQANASIPSPVTNLTASYTGGNIVLNWTNPAGDDADKIRISWTGTGTGSQEIDLEGPGQFQTRDILIPAADGAAYTVSVRTAISTQESAAVTVLAYPDTTAPGPVTGLEGVFHPAGTGGAIDVEWMDPADTVGDLKEILLEWYVSTAPGTILGSVTVPKGQQKHTMSGLVSGIEYALRVRAVDNAGNKSAEETVTVNSDVTPPGTVTGLSGDYNQAGGNITLYWTDPADSDLKELRITIGRGGQTTEDTVARGTQTYVIQPVAFNSGIYTISLSAVDTSENGGEAETITVRTDNKPGTPTGLAAVNNNAGTGSLLISWSGVGNATAYEVVHNTINSSGSAVNTGVSISGLAATITGLNNGTLYYVWVRAKNGTVNGDWSASTTGTPRSNVAALSSLMVNGVTSDISTDKDNPAKVNIPYDSNSIVMYGVSADNGSVSYQYDPSNGGFINSGQTVAVTVTVTAENGSVTQKYYVDVTRPVQTGIGIGGTGEPFSVSASPVTAVMSWKANESITFELIDNLLGELYDVRPIQWYVDGTAVTGGHFFPGRLTLQARDYLVTTHRLTVTAEQGGTQYSRELTFTVTE